MNIKFIGHSCIEIESGDNSLIIDPFITGNPLAKIKANEIKSKFILLTHGHADHFGDTLEIAGENDALIIATAEIAYFCEKMHRKAHAMNLGGAFTFPFGKVKLTLAHHSSSLPDGSYAGDPAGLLLNIEGKTIYHAGDTALFYDMKLIGETEKIDFAFLPIGDNFTMGIDDAVKAAEYINADTIIPIHYNTFDVIKQDAIDFKRKIESIGKKCVIMQPGDSIKI
ncbi:MAG TPA: metal-dependent hydrolase [Ignavibacteria bacterium]|nr:metal-dependent hydrolase [Ignavibacteria bacterium]